MFDEISFKPGTPVYLQIKNHIKELILKGMLSKDEKLPSTREFSKMLRVSRNSVLLAYEELQEDGFIHMANNVGAFVLDVHVKKEDCWELDWSKQTSRTAEIAESLDLIKNTIKTERRTINFRGLAPDKELFDLEGIKRAFLNTLSKEGHNILNYGYAKGFRPLIEYLLQYMKSKGIDTSGKDILITNGFTEGFSVVLSTICEKEDKILCENPTHNTAIKIMKMQGLKIIGTHMEKDGINLEQLRESLRSNQIKLGYLVPSYHNPTGIVMPLEKRLKVYELFKEYKVPIVEDGFSEELRYSGAHIPSIAALAGSGNGVIYIGSFSKILFPGLRIGWILADKRLISSIESVKKSSNIHTSFLDQAIMYEFLREGNLDKCIKKARKIYKERYSLAMEYAQSCIPAIEITGDGGMYIFIKLREGMKAQEVLSKCIEEGVVFMPGDIFYTNGAGYNTIRLSFANADTEDIERGIHIIGNAVRALSDS